MLNLRHLLKYKTEDKKKKKKILSQKKKINALDTQPKGYNAKNYE